MDGEESNELEHTLPGIPSISQNISQEIPKEIGPYKIESLLDSGGMSLLYLGSKDGGKESVAIKVLSSKFANHKDARRRFIHEGEIISLADHPNIVKFLSQGEWEGGLYLAMEFVQGVSLRKFIQHTPLSLRKALEVVLQIAYAVCHMHTHGIIHCDLKPENILVTEEGVVKLIDFGIAHRMAEEVFDTKELRQFVGTPSYMSPEQRDDASIVSYPSDIYSLGIIAYELVLGKLSHGHVHLGLMPAGLQKILTHALQPDSKERYQDMVDFITDVSNYLNAILESPGKEEKGPLPQALENLQETLLVLTKEKGIDWQGCDVNVLFHKGVGLSTLFFDCITLPDGRKLAVIAESGDKSGKSVIDTMLVRGMVRTLAQLVSGPKQLIEMLQRLVMQEPTQPIIGFTALFIDPSLNNLEFASQGGGVLLLVEEGKENAKAYFPTGPAIGVDPAFEVKTEMIVCQQPFRFVIDSSGFLSEDRFQAAWKELSFPAGKEVERLFRLLRAEKSNEFEVRSIALISGFIGGSHG